MPLTRGTKLGPFEIVGPLGIGGMGEVYRARDTRLGRDVAIKILPKEMSADPARRQRFEREAKTISGLNHPNICTLHDVGSQDGLDYLVMECVEGDTLAKRLEKGPVVLEQVLKYGAQIADALDIAHRAGIVHRDLKPGNVMLTSGGAKLLDFGLAKPAALMSGATTTAVVAVQSPVTQEGTIVGTFQYMSPEQVEGKELDGRSDIFSLGAVLYEMLTGQRAFLGKSQLSVASAILEKEPVPISTIKPMTPPALDHAIRRCLAKEPEERWQTARDLAQELKWIGESGSQVDLQNRKLLGRRLPQRLVWTIAGALGLTVAAVTTIQFRAPKPSLPVLSLSVGAPEGTDLSVSGGDGMLALSPDGRYLAFVAETNGQRWLWLRDLVSGEVKLQSNTLNVTYPFWAPDSRFIGFFADDKLKKIAVPSGSVTTVSEECTDRGAAWNKDGTMLFTPSTISPLWRVSADGGKPERVTETHGLESHRWPMFLPDAKHFLYSEYNQGVVATELGSKETKVVLPRSGSVVYVSGYLLFVREGTLYAQRFDPDKLEFSEEIFPLATGLRDIRARNYLPFSASQTGLLAYRTSGVRAQLTWFDRSGHKLSTAGPPEFFTEMDLSPDESHIAADRGLLEGSSEIWTVDLLHDSLSRFSYGFYDVAPAWSPDGRFLAYACQSKTNEYNICKKDSAGTGAEVKLLSIGKQAYPDDWSRDGRFLLYEQPGEATSSSLWVLPMTGDARPITYLNSSYYLAHARFSPDGRWVTYASNETGRVEVYVQSFPAGHGKWQISSHGGDQPSWRWDGKELYYISADRSLVAVPVENGDAFKAGTPANLFAAHVGSNGIQDDRNQYVASHDGRRFLINTVDERAGQAPITVVVNWMGLLKK